MGRAARRRDRQDICDPIADRQDSPIADRQDIDPSSIRHLYRGGPGSKGADNTLAGHQKRKQRTKLRPRVWTDRGERLVEQPSDVHANVRPLPASDEIQRQAHVQRGRRDLPRRRGGGQALRRPHTHAGQTLERGTQRVRLVRGEGRGVST